MTFTQLIVSALFVSVIWIIDFIKDPPDDNFENF